MSKKQNNDIFHDIEIMSELELAAMYGIEITEAGIFDPIENQMFRTLKEWAGFYNEISNEDLVYSKISKGMSIDWDDEYY